MRRRGRIHLYSRVQHDDGFLGILLCFLYFNCGSHSRQGEVRRQMWNIRWCCDVHWICHGDLGHRRRFRGLGLFTSFTHRYLDTTILKDIQHNF